MNALVTDRRRLLTVGDFHKMGEAHILSEDDRVELIEGELINMAPIGSMHAGYVTRLLRLFMQRVGDQAVVFVQNPIQLPPRNEPLPDITLLRPRPDDYTTGLPGPSDVLLVVEISDTTLAYDRDAKMPIYARHGIPEAWVIDVNAKQVMVFLDPGQTGYQRVLTLGQDATITLARLPSIFIHLADLW